MKYVSVRILKNTEVAKQFARKVKAKFPPFKLMDKKPHGVVLLRRRK